jgi:hypothetical protein
LPASHASLVSHPKEVADFILEAATEIAVMSSTKTAMHA